MFVRCAVDLFGEWGSLTINVLAMFDGVDAESIVDRRKENAVVAYPEPQTALELSLQSLDVAMACSRIAEQSVEH